MYIPPPPAGADHVEPEEAEADHMSQNRPNKPGLSAIIIISYLIHSSLHPNGIPEQSAETRIGYTGNLARRRAQMITSNKDFQLNLQQQFKQWLPN